MYNILKKTSPSHSLSILVFYVILSDHCKTIFWHIYCFLFFNVVLFLFVRVCVFLQLLLQCLVLFLFCSVLFTFLLFCLLEFRTNCKLLRLWLMLQFEFCKEITFIVSLFFFLLYQNFFCSCSCGCSILLLFCFTFQVFTFFIF